MNTGIKSRKISNPQIFYFRRSTPKNTLNSTLVLKQDEETSKLLIQLGKESGAKAIKESKALGLSITYAENNIIYKEHPDGTREIIGTIPEHF